MPPNPDPFRMCRPVGSFKSRKSADCTIGTSDGQHSWSMRLLDSIADLFRLGWHLVRALFMSREALELENEKMRRQIAELKAEAARADGENKDVTRPDES